MSGHDDVYRQAARIRAVALAIRGDDESMALRDIAEQLDAIGDAWAASEGDYSAALIRANDEIVMLRGELDGRRHRASWAQGRLGLLREAQASVALDGETQSLGEPGEPDGG